jgi:hypothetical protein
VLDKALASKAKGIMKLRAVSNRLSDALLQLPDASELVDAHTSDVVVRGARVQAELLATLDWWRRTERAANTKQVGTYASFKVVVLCNVVLCCMVKRWNCACCSG